MRPRRARIFVLLGLAGASVGSWADADAANWKDDGQAAGGVNVCLNARDVESIEILADDMVLLRGRLDRYWLNRMPVRCVGLASNMLVTMERTGSRICAHDRFRASERGSSMPDLGPVCRFGKFESVSAEQIAVLRQSLKED